MPLPKRRDNESEEDFISRCMGNESMKEEFPDSDQRYAVCKQKADEAKAFEVDKYFEE